MFFEKELRLLCSTFSKSRVPVTVSTVSAPDFSFSQDERNFVANRVINKLIFESSVAQRLEPNTVYSLTGELSLSFILLLLPTAAAEKLLIIGPFTFENLNEQKVLEYIEAQGIPASAKRMLTDFCTTVPLLPENSALFTLLDCFCEKLWGSSFSAVNLTPETLSPELPIISKEEQNLDETLLNMKALEYRYSLEKQILSAVRSGSSKSLSNVFSHFSTQHFEMRATDPLRNAKNYCIIMNTLLRKAAEEGGVHPIYIDSTSSIFAKKIETIDSTSKLSAFMNDMLETYCRLVRLHSTKNFSPLIEKAVLIIDSDFSAPISLSVLSEKIGISKVYLSSLFKKEVGKTVTEYIKEKRMDKAALLLSTTSLQIQNIALYCGIEDVQYFSKLFKSRFKMTPCQYRKATVSS